MKPRARSLCQSIKETYEETRRREAPWHRCGRTGFHGRGRWWRSRTSTSPTSWRRLPWCRPTGPRISRKGTGLVLCDCGARAAVERRRARATGRLRPLGFSRREWRAGLMLLAWWAVTLGCPFGPGRTVYQFCQS